MARAHSPGERFHDVQRCAHQQQDGAHILPLRARVLTTSSVNVNGSVTTYFFSLYFCRVNPTSLKVRLGELQIGSGVEALPHYDVGVTAVNGHPSFQEGSLFNDVAVLLLEQPITFSQHIGSICLPQYAEQLTQCIVTGWGQETLTGTLSFSM